VPSAAWRTWFSTVSRESVIRIEGLSKRYRLGTGTPGLHRAIRRLLRPGPRPQQNVIWALRDIDLEVRRGEVLGIIGPNGSGKSTLLKILARITEPTTGRVLMRGRIASLLEVGTGFHPDLTGRDNIYLNGSLLGLSFREIRERFASIVEFAGTELFLDTPVKHYSSGMYVRLAFAVAAHLEPDILVVDEVLAVGDVAFQRKCLGRMQAVADSGRTVLFVSHNLAAINHFCTRAVLLREGQIVDQGEPARIVGRYLAETFACQRQRSYPRDPAKPMQIRRISLHGLPDAPGGVLYRTRPFEVRVVYQVNAPISGSIVSLLLEKPDGGTVCQTRDIDSDPECRRRYEPGLYQATVRFPGNLLNAGTYALRAAIESTLLGRDAFDHQPGLTFELLDPEGATLLHTRGRQRPGVLFLNLPWMVEMLDDGEPAPQVQDTSACVGPP